MPRFGRARSLNPQPGVGLANSLKPDDPQGPVGAADIDGSSSGRPGPAGRGAVSIADPPSGKIIDMPAPAPAGAAVRRLPTTINRNTMDIVVSGGLAVLAPNF